MDSQLSRRAQFQKARVYTILAFFAVASLPYASSASFAATGNKSKPAAPQYTASAEQPTISYVDPRTGKPIWTGQASSSAASPGQTANSVVGVLHNVRGTFYQSGVAVDRMTAPTVTAVQQSGSVTVTASGGVFVQSISQPDSSLRCDKAVWNSATNKIIGTGHVVLKKGAFTQQGPSILGDAKLKAAVMPAPGVGATSPGARAVHLHLPPTKRG